eukprot:4020513-Prymnesium_polylepis.1
MSDDVGRSCRTVGPGLRVPGCVSDVSIFRRAARGRSLPMGALSGRPLSCEFTLSYDSAAPFQIQSRWRRGVWMPLAAVAGSCFVVRGN